MRNSIGIERRKRTLDSREASNKPEEIRRDAMRIRDGISYIYFFIFSKKKNNALVVGDVFSDYIERRTFLVIPRERSVIHYSLVPPRVVFAQQ